MRDATLIVILLLALAIPLAPLGGEAEQASKVPRIGILWPGPPSAAAPYRTALLEALRDLGYVEGQNVALEERYSGGRDDTLPDLAAELVRLKVDVLLTPSERATRAARQATTTVPIVFLGTGDPVAFGHVASFARPGGNVTGLYPFAPELTGGKPLELLKEMAPAVSQVAVLWNPPPGTEAQVKAAYENSARILGVQLQFLDVRGPEDFDRAFDRSVRDGARALLVPTFPVMVVHRARIAELAAKHRLPAMAGFREFVDAGGLMAYGASLPDLFRRAAAYLAKILKGAKPAELPVEQAVRYDLVVHLRTAKALGLTIPPSILLRADQLIE